MPKLPRSGELLGKKILAAKKERKKKYKCYPVTEGENFTLIMLKCVSLDSPSFVILK